jgi:hypothetical protein
MSFNDKEYYRGRAAQKQAAADLAATDSVAAIHR